MEDVDCMNVVMEMQYTHYVYVYHDCSRFYCFYHHAVNIMNNTLNYNTNSGTNAKLNTVTKKPERNNYISPTNVHNNPKDNINSVGINYNYLLSIVCYY